MDSRTRILKAIKHEEPDRVPLYETVINSKIGEYILKKKVHPWGLGSSTRIAMELLMKKSWKEYKKFVEDSFMDLLEVSYKVGMDMVAIAPQAFVAPIDFGLYNVGVADIYDVEIEKRGENGYILISKDPLAKGFWNTCAYVPETGTFQMISDSIKEKGEKELERYVDYLENKDLTQVPDTLKYGLEAMEKVVEKNNKDYNMAFLGHGDIEYPCFTPFHALFLELMATNGNLAHRYMRVTTDSMKAVNKLQLDMEIDGIIGGVDWCYKNGPMMSPDHFNEFLAPYLKDLVDQTHSYGKFFVKHLDGNANKLLDSLVNYCGIDVYNPIEPVAGMDIKKVKEMYGDKITLCGNIDCGDVLSNWTPEEISEDVKRIIREASPGGGHIFSTSNALHDGIPLENALAYIDAVKKYGVYPIDI